MRNPTTSLHAALLVVGLAAVPCSAGALEARLTLRETAQVARSGGVVCCGVPFAKGAVKDLARLSVSVNGEKTPAQFTRLAPWGDGSVRWALMTCRVQVPAGGKRELTIRDDGLNPKPALPVSVTDGADAVAVSTGPLQFSVSKKRSDLLSGLKVDGKELLTAKGRGLVLHTAGAPKQVQKGVGRRAITVTEYGSGKPIVADAPTEVTIEESGPMRAVILVRGRFSEVHDGLLGYSARLTAYAGSKAVNLRVWLENNGAHGYKKEPEWFYFDGLALEFGLGLGDAVKAYCEGKSASGQFKVRQGCHGLDWAGLHYEIASDGKELARGKRTDGVVSLSGPNGRLTAAVRHFWQNYDKAIELDGDRLNVWLWPTDSQWPRPPVGRAKPARFTKRLLNALPGGVHKGHEVVLDFSGRPAEETRAELAAPLTAVSPECFASTEAANGLFAPAVAKSGDEDLDWKFKCWNNMASNIVDPESKGGLTYAATLGAQKGSVWFGWMDFGDLCSPYGGAYSGNVTPRNLHYDWTWTVLLQYLRTGDAAYLERGLAMARHQMEVDFNWSDRDAAPHNRLFRHDWTQSATHTDWSNTYGPKQPRAEKNWLAGVALYYMLTGDPKARECALRNYGGLQDAWIKRVKSKPSRYDIYPGLLTIRNLLSLNAITGDTKYLDDVQALLKNHIYVLQEHYGPHLFSPGNEVWGQDYHRLAEQYCHGVATLCELHHRTRDERLGALLVAGAEKEFAKTFYHAPLYLSDLYAYVGHTAGKKKLVEKALDCFIDTFPESRKPPVFLSGSRDWTRRSAMVLQAGHLLQYVCWQRRKGGGK